MPKSSIRISPAPATLHRIAPWCCRTPRGAPPVPLLVVGANGHSTGQEQGRVAETTELGAAYLFELRDLVGR